MGLIPDFTSINSIGGALAALIQLLILAILARAVMSWFVRDPDNPVMQVLNSITDPVLQPLRRIMPRTGMMDFTPLIAIILLSIISSMVSGI